MKTLNIEIPEGYEIDQEKSTFEKIVFKEIKKALPKTWEDLKELSGCYVMLNSGIAITRGAKIASENRHIFKTEEQAKAAIALAQLSQLRDDYRQGWIPDYTNHLQVKYSIWFEKNEQKISGFWFRGEFLSFPSREIAEEFLNNFLDLINQARPLLS